MKEATVIKFKHILCPVDFSETSIRALTYATALANWYEAQLEVLHVVPALEEGLISEESSRTSEPGMSTSRNAITSEIRRALEATAHFVDHARECLHLQFAQESPTWCEIEEVVVIDRAYKAVLQQARTAKTDLIVMGAQGTAGLVRRNYKQSVSR